MAWEKMLHSKLGNLKQDSESWPYGMQLFHLMGHYITVVCTVHIINGGLRGTAITSWDVCC